MNRWATTPIRRTCRYMELMRRAQMTANNLNKAGPRGGCMCKHPKAQEIFKKLFPRSPRMAGFIGFTAPGEYLPQIKTSPRWCPLRLENKEV